MRKLRSVFALLLFLILALGPAMALAQAQLPSADQTAPRRRGIDDPAPDPEVERMRKEREKLANKSRQQALKKDTENLLKLATELKQYVDKTNENVLSLDVLRKAEEIEKLAKSVKDKMKAQ